MAIDFNTLHLAQCKNLKRSPFMECFLALDPGQTTGIALFNKGALDKAWQYKPDNLEHVGEAASYISSILHRQTSPLVMVIEDYRVYKWKSEDHTWNDLFTPRLIGAIEWLSYTNNIPLFKQSAQNAKSFATDDRLKEWGFYQKGQKHARDAIRHGVHWLLFNKASTLPCNGETFEYT